jgi:hypothetical protein
MSALGAGEMEQVMTKVDMREFKTEDAPVTTPAGPPLPEPLRGDPAAHCRP